MSEWVAVAASRNRSGTVSDVRSAYRRWLRLNGIDWNPFKDDEMRLDNYRVPLAGGGAGCCVVISVRADALRRLGLEAPTLG